MTWSLLLVEDVPDIRHIIELALGRDARFDVTSCACGSDAVEQAASDRAPFDCVMLDYMLPDMSNEACVRGLRAGRATRYAKLILITAHVPRGGIDTYLDAGLDAVILKPFDILALGDQIVDVLATARGPKVVRDRVWRSARRSATAD